MPRTGPFGCLFVEIYPSGSCGWADRQAPHLHPPEGLPELLAALLGRFQAADSVLQGFPGSTARGLSGSGPFPLPARMCCCPPC